MMPGEARTNSIHKRRWAVYFVRSRPGVPTAIPMSQEKDLVRVNVMLSREDLAALDDMAQAEGLSRSAMLRRIISRAMNDEPGHRGIGFPVVESIPVSITFEEALEVARGAAKRLKGFDGIAEIRRWRERQ
ncbi:MAG: CopG family transcriptional regulator [Firmicutes bacterium]|nr:CopG family transcriptional regulator [Bacillota bacterium]